MDVNNLTNIYNQNPTLQGQYSLQQYLDLYGGSSTPASTATATTTATTPTTTNAGQGIINANINQFQNQGGDNDQNIRTDYNSRPAYEAAFGTNMGDPMANISTGALNNLGVMGDYRENPPSGAAQFINKALNYVPYIGPVKRGMEFLGSKLKGVMPVNKRVILENQLRGSGVFTDDIGRITVGPDGKYNTPEGIMAGYGANQMTDKTFDKRTGNIGQSLQNKTSLTEKQINDIVNEIEETGTYTGTYTDKNLGVKNLFSNLVNVNMAKFNFKNTKTKQQKIIDFQNKERENKKKAAQDAKNARDLATVQARAARGDSMSQIGKDMYTGSGMAFEAGNTPSGGGFTGGKETDTSPGGYNSPRRDGGLMGRGGSRKRSYFKGGLVSLRGK